MENFEQIIDSFQNQHILVLGEAMLDCYVEGSSHRLCQEAPVPVVAVEARKNEPGGAANTAVNASSLGAQVSFLSVVGDDCEGATLRGLLDARGISTAGLLVEQSRQTLSKNRIVSACQLLVRFDQGDTKPVSPATEEALIRRLMTLFPCCHAVIISDYGYGVITSRVIETLAELQSRFSRVIVGDSKRLEAYRGIALTAVKPNYQEALNLLNQERSQETIGRAERLLVAGPRLLEKTGAKIVALTLDTEGALILERDRSPYRTFTRPSLQCRAAGAGDTYISALALALSVGASTPMASELAAAAAAVVVAKKGTAICDAQELQAHFADNAKKIEDRKTLGNVLEHYRQQGKKIVFTNGCFDILHRGHVTYLTQAKALGDILVVGVNSDESIRLLKGPERPINALEDRLQVLAALTCVDHVVPFGESRPDNLIEWVRPHVFVKGGDYHRDRLPEATLVESLGGAVCILPLVAERSTSGMIERIRASYESSNGSQSHPQQNRPWSPRPSSNNGMKVRKNRLLLKPLE